MAALVLAVFTASLLGSLHCAGMCGAFVAFAVGLDANVSGRTRAALQAAYHVGRLVTYTALGAAAGALGGAFDLAGEAVGIQRAAVALAGTLMVVFGVLALLRIAGVRLPAAPAPGILREAAGRALRLASDRPPLARAALTGLCTTLLPCGWLYAFVITASGTAGAPLGALVMAVFWLGTLPILIAVGTGVQALLARFGGLGRRMPVIMASIVIAVGLFTVFDRGRLDAAMIAGRADTMAGASVDRVKALDSTEAPCCHERADGE